jgi:hypothetical protein
MFTYGLGLLFCFLVFVLIIVALFRRCLSQHNDNRLSATDIMIAAALPKYTKRVV